MSTAIAKVIFLQFLGDIRSKYKIEVVYSLPVIANLIVLKKRKEDDNGWEKVEEKDRKGKWER